MIVGDANSPAVLGRRSGERDVAAQAHKHAARGTLRSARFGAVGGQRLRGRAQVEADPAR